MPATCGVHFFPDTFRGCGRVGTSPGVSRKAAEYAEEKGNKVTGFKVTGDRNLGGTTWIQVGLVLVVVLGMCFFQVQLFSAYKDWSGPSVEFSRVGSGPSVEFPRVGSGGCMPVQSLETRGQAIFDPCMEHFPLRDFMAREEVRLEGRFLVLYRDGVRVGEKWVRR